MYCWFRGYKLGVRILPAYLLNCLWTSWVAGLEMTMISNLHRIFAGWPYCVCTYVPLCYGCGFQSYRVVVAGDSICAADSSEGSRLVENICCS
jgi:hypothetical protein